jgi:RNA polymerase sigma-70 factor (ECF subfamily)
VNRTLNALRKTRRLANLETEVHEDSASFEPDTDRSFLAASIEEATAKLSPGARAVFMLHDVEGYTHEEIAQELGITTGGSKSQLFKARAKLRKLLAHLVDAVDVNAVRTPSLESQHVAPLS